MIQHCIVGVQRVVMGEQWVRVRGHHNVLAATSVGISARWQRGVRWCSVKLVVHTACRTLVDDCDDDVGGNNNKEEQGGA